MKFHLTMKIGSYIYWGPFSLQLSYYMSEKSRGTKPSSIKWVKVIIKLEDESVLTISVKGRLKINNIEAFIDQLKTFLALNMEERSYVEPKLTQHVNMGNVQQLAESTSSSAYNRIRNLVLDNLRGSYFTSFQVKRLYEEIYNEEIKLSTVSTYLARLYKKGYLKRIKYSGKWVYQTNR